MKAVAVATFEGKEIPIVYHPSMDKAGWIPQAAALRLGGKDYILVGVGLLNAPAVVQQWIIAHELGHIKYKHQRSKLLCIFHNIMRNLIPFKPTIDRELIADSFANKMVGPRGGIMLFLYVMANGAESVEIKKRYAACVAYKQGEMA